MSRGFFETALICESGHVISSTLNSTPEYRTFKGCSICGKPVISSCKNCGVAIIGNHVTEHTYTVSTSYDVFSGESRGKTRSFTEVSQQYTCPAYCHNCLEPYPWTEVAIAAATETVHEMTELTESEQQQLIADVPSVLTDTPQTGPAVNRIQKVLGKVSPFLREIFLKSISDVTVTYAKIKLSELTGINMENLKNG
jgi:hypothetical protein